MTKTGMTYQRYIYITPRQQRRPTDAGFPCTITDDYRRTPSCSSGYWHARIMRSVRAVSSAPQRMVAL